ncbi:hypothetical protein ABN028_34430 [Actinopolymorpha sp. B17G11]
MPMWLSAVVIGGVGLGLATVVGIVFDLPWPTNFDRLVHLLSKVS